MIILELQWYIFIAGADKAPGKQSWHLHESTEEKKERRDGGTQLHFLPQSK